MPAEAAGGGDEAIGIALEEFPVDSRLVVIPLEECEARQLNQVAVSGLILCEQGEVVVDLVAALGFASGVVHAPATGWSLAAVFMRHIGLGAEDRFDPSGTALFVELERAVHVPVIGDPDCGLTIGMGALHQLVESCSTIEHRELGMDMQVGERIRHRWNCRELVPPTAGKPVESQRRDSLNVPDPSRRRIGVRDRCPVVPRGSRATGVAASVQSAVGQRPAGRTGWLGCRGTGLRAIQQVVLGQPVARHRKEPHRR